uniref:Uncharacterized protein n=1 Tax=Myotis myotis TaxID=51298 RepID=A0A7J7YED3_MYOMY|nr:hypothetical protein mMyoMyo1_010948 [Myotis myotis]
MACGGEDGLEETPLPSVTPSSAPPLGRDPQGHEFDLLATGSDLTGLLRACPEAANRNAAPWPVRKFPSCLDFRPLLWWFPELQGRKGGGRGEQLWCVEQHCPLPPRETERHHHTTKDSLPRVGGLRLNTSTTAEASRRGGTAKTA